MISQSVGEENTWEKRKCWTWYSVFISWKMQKVQLSDCKEKHIFDDVQMKYRFGRNFGFVSEGRGKFWDFAWEGLLNGERQVVVNGGLRLEGLLLHTTYETYLRHQKFTFNG